MLKELVDNTLPEYFNKIDDRDSIIDPSLGFVDEAAEISQKDYDKIKPNTGEN